MYLAGILLVATGLRLWTIDRTSLWYDELVTMRVARAGSVPELVALLNRIDGTRAPLHPLFLQTWLRAFGPSAFAGRSASALCGILTVGLVYLLGRQAFDATTGRWAAWLTAVCPPLVYYSQERGCMPGSSCSLAFHGWSCCRFADRQRRLSVLFTGCCCRRSSIAIPWASSWSQRHGLAYLLVRHALKLKLGSWLTIQIAVILTVAPWLRRYLDHGTDYPMPRYSIRFLLAVPIEYVGGNGIALLVCLATVVLGLFAGGGLMSKLPEKVVLLTWSAIPPVLMYVYSYFFQPIFGPPRYHLFIAPAYLILLAHGLSKLPGLVRWPAAVVGLVLSLSLLSAGVYDRALKSDWRALARWLEQQARAEGLQSPVTIVVHPSDPRFPRDQVEAAQLLFGAEARRRSGGRECRACGAFHHVRCILSREGGRRIG